MAAAKLLQNGNSQAVRLPKEFRIPGDAVKVLGRPNEARTQSRQHSPRDAAISAVTLFELEYGVEKSRYRQRSADALNGFLKPLNTLGIDHAAAREAAAIRA